jgi:hypothetical protein
MCWLFKAKSNLYARKGVRELFQECNGYLHRFEIEASGVIQKDRIATSYMNFQVYNHRTNAHTKFVLRERPGNVYLDIYKNDEQGSHYATTIKIAKLQDFTKEIYDAKI